MVKLPSTIIKLETLKVIAKRFQSHQIVRFMLKRSVCLKLEPKKKFGEQNFVQARLNLDEWLGPNVGPP